MPLSDLTKLAYRMQRMKTISVIIHKQNQEF